MTRRQTSKLTVLVSGMIAAVPRQGGATWAVLQYLLGLKRLGHAVYFVEPVSAEALLPAGTNLEQSKNAAYFRRVVGEFGLSDRAALVVAGTRETVGLPYEALRELAAGADLLLDISGLLRGDDLFGRVPIRVYLDIDPGFTQLWQTVQGVDMKLDGHTHFVSIGQSMGEPGCLVPTCGRRWITTSQPVVMEEWPVAGSPRRDTWTTVANWRGYGSIEHAGQVYGQKVHSLRQFISLPMRSSETFALALSIHRDEKVDLQALTDNGWRLLDPLAVASTPESYRRFIQGSRGEFGIAKSGYVAARCGWFSDRSICYLASGRPVIAHETGFSDFLPSGEGLFAFSSMDGVLSALHEVSRDYRRHCRAARDIAEEYFDSDKVLTQLLERIQEAPCQSS